MNVNTCAHILHRGIATDVCTAGSRAGSRDLLRQCLRSISTTTSNSITGRRVFVRDRTHDVKPARTRRCGAILPITPDVRFFSSSPSLNKKGKKAARNDTSKEQKEEQEDDGGKQAVDDPFDFTILSTEIKEAHERLRDGLAKLRAGGRFNPEVLERLRVHPDKSSDNTVPLSDLAQVIPKGRTVHVIVGEQDHIKPVTSAIQGGDLSLTPQLDPTGANPLLLEIKIPPPTAESRQNAVKDAIKSGEKAVVAIQKARAKQHKKHRAMQSIKTIRPDDLRKAGTEMEKLVENGQAEAKKIVDNAKKVLESA